VAQKYEFLEIPTAYTEDEYLEQLRKLLPRGPIWGFIRKISVVVLQDVIGPAGIQDVPGSAGIQDVINSPSKLLGSTLGSFLSVIAAELNRMETSARDLMREMVTGLSVALLPEWEALAGITPTGTTEQRQLVAHAYLWGGFQTTTKEFFINLALGLGFVVTIEEGSSETVDTRAGIARAGASRVGAVGGAGKAIYVTVVSGDLANLDQLKIIFEKWKPAHLVIVWIIL
jgi:hypothetical protein